MTPRDADDPFDLLIEALEQALNLCASADRGADLATIRATCDRAAALARDLATGV